MARRPVTEAVGAVKVVGSVAVPTSESETRSLVADAAAVKAVGRQEIPEWDVCHGPVATGLGRMILPIAIAMRVFTVIGATLLSLSGYAIAKVFELFGGEKAIDSVVFKRTQLPWLWLNGIFPHVTYMPLGSAARLEVGRQKDEAPAEPDVADPRLTPVIVSNHTCYLDGLILAQVFDAPKVVAVAGAKKMPIFGKLMEEMDVIFLDKSTRSGFQAASEAIKDHCSRWRRGDRSLLIFPEGGTTNGADLKQFKKGAFLSGAPVRPVLMVYTGSLDPSSATYRKTPDGLVELSASEWAKQAFGHFLHPVQIRVLPPYFPSEEERADPDLYAEGVREKMQKELTAMRREFLGPGR